MKLKFKPQAFQTDAVAAVVDLFRGQDRRQDTFAITNELQSNFSYTGFGVVNALTIGDDRLLDNMRDVQTLKPNCALWI